MKIQDAIASGKRFKRKDWAKFDFLAIEQERVLDDSRVPYSLGKSDILADDWEIEEKKVEITESQLREAWDKHVSSPRSVCDPSNVSQKFDNVLVALGFKN